MMFQMKVMFRATAVIWLAAMGSVLSCTVEPAYGEDGMIRVGIIGLDTSHAPAFAKVMNAEDAPGDLGRCHVVAAYPHGSATIESSYSRIPKYTEELRGMGVEITDSIAELLPKVDCVLLETNDGTLHLEQALEVFAAGKPVFIDKPVASNLSEVVAIYRAAEQSGVPMFSSSSLRYTSGARAARAGDYGKLVGCSAYSPCALEPSHVDLFWYGIHGVETLYTCMGPGCQSVSHTSTDDFELAVGTWSDGRIGTFRGLRTGARGYGAMVFTDQQIKAIGRYEGYEPLVERIATFFRTHEPPVVADETIELYAFMQAAAESKKQGGTVVKIADVMAAAGEQAGRLLEQHQFAEAE